MPFSGVIRHAPGRPSSASYTTHFTEATPSAMHKLEHDGQRRRRLLAVLQQHTAPSSASTGHCCRINSSSVSIDCSSATSVVINRALAWASPGQLLAHLGLLLDLSLIHI